MYKLYIKLYTIFGFEFCVTDTDDELYKHYLAKYDIPYKHKGSWAKEDFPYSVSIYKVPKKYKDEVLRLIEEIANVFVSSGCPDYKDKTTELFTAMENTKV